MDNKTILDLQNAVRNLSQGPNKFTEQQIHELSSMHPYYGYVDISVKRVEPFVMFSNNDDFVARKFLWNGPNAYEKLSVNLWAALSVNSSSILDVGSYTGIYSLISCHVNRKSKVYAFEVLDRVYNRLLINARVNGCANLNARCLAVSDSDSEIDLNIYVGNSILTTGSSTEKKYGDRAIHEIKKVPSVRLDTLFKDRTERISLIKIDVEGAESKVLDGAQSIIKNDCPDILIEILKEADIDNLHKLLSAVPYNFFHLHDDTEVIEPVSQLKHATSMNDLNTLITTKTLKELEALLK